MNSQLRETLREVYLSEFSKRTLAKKTLRTIFYGFESNNSYILVEDREQHFVVYTQTP